MDMVENSGKDGARSVSKMKKTEIGMIPEDWKVKELGEVLLSNPDYGINAAAVKYDDTLPTYLRITDIDDNGRFIKDNLSSVDDLNSGKYYLNTNEIVFARTGASVGKTYLYNRKDGDLVFAGFLIRTKINTDKAHSKFIFYNTQTKYFQNWIIANSMRSGQPGINSNEVKSLQIPLPPLAEQEAIATALSDADAWIESLEQLIAKKRLIKQGAMQELLTPPSPSSGNADGEALEPWEVKKLGEMSIIYTGKKNNQDKIENGKYPFFVRSQTVERINSYSFNGEAILIPGEGNLGSIVHYIYGKFDFHQRVYKISGFTGLHGRFLYFYFRMYFGTHAMQNTVKATVDSIRLPTLEEFIIKFPSLSEQTRIATILSDMDAELEALEKQLGKARQIKQGMMQELLTGRIRL